MIGRTNALKSGGGGIPVLTVLPLEYETFVAQNYATGTLELSFETYTIIDYIL